MLQSLTKKRLRTAMDLRFEIWDGMEAVSIRVSKIRSFGRDRFFRERRPPCRPKYLRDDRFCGEIVSSRRPMATVRSEIGPSTPSTATPSCVAKKGVRANEKPNFL